MNAKGWAITAGLGAAAGAVAVLAGGVGGKDTEGGALGGLHLTHAPAHRAGLGRGALLCARAAAVLTGLVTGDADALFAAENGLFKGQLQGHAEVFALAGAVLPGLLTAETAAKAAAEHGTENIS